MQLRRRACVQRSGRSDWLSPKSSRNQQDRAEAKEHFGPFAMFAGLDSPASSKLTREWLGWEPNQPGLIADVAQSSHFDIQE